MLLHSIVYACRCARVQAEFEAEIFQIEIDLLRLVFEESLEFVRRTSVVRPTAHHRRRS